MRGTYRQRATGSNRSLLCATSLLARVAPALCAAAWPDVILDLFAAPRPPSRRDVALQRRPPLGRPQPLGHPPPLGRPQPLCRPQPRRRGIFRNL